MDHEDHHVPADEEHEDHHVSEDELDALGDPDAAYDAYRDALLEEHPYAY